MIWYTTREHRFLGASVFSSSIIYPKGTPVTVVGRAADSTPLVRFPGGEETYTDEAHPRHRV